MATIKEHKQLLLKLLNKEKLPNIRNIEYIKKYIKKEDKTFFALKKILDSYGQAKWWLSNDIEVKDYGQELENVYINTDEEYEEGINIIFDNPNGNVLHSIKTPETLNKLYNKMQNKLNNLTNEDSDENTL